MREAARLQGFPDSYRFVGSWAESMRQIGNAVPLGLYQQITHSIKSVLSTPQGSVKVFVLPLRLLSFGVGMGDVRAGSGREVQWSMP